jgi:hypothetical protein
VKVSLVRHFIPPILHVVDEEEVLVEAAGVGAALVEVDEAGLEPLVEVPAALDDVDELVEAFAVVVVDALALVELDELEELVELVELEVDVVVVVVVDAATGVEAGADEELARMRDPSAFI